MPDVLRLKKYFLTGLALVACLGLHASEDASIKVMGLVAGRALSNRQVLLDIILENPKRVKTEGTSWIGPEEMSRGFDRCVTQRMIIEDLRIVGDGVNSIDQVSKRQKQLKNDLGIGRYNQLLKDFELTDQAVREKLSQKIQVERALQEKVQLAFNTRAEKVEPGQEAGLSKKAIEEWIAQLKARYRVQVFRKSDRM